MIYDTTLLTIIFICVFAIADMCYKDWSVSRYGFRETLLQRYMRYIHS